MEKKEWACRIYHCILKLSARQAFLSFEIFSCYFFIQKLKMVFEESSSPGTRIPGWAAAGGEHTLRSSGGADERPH